MKRRKLLTGIFAAIAAPVVMSAERVLGRNEDAKLRKWIRIVITEERNRLEKERWTVHPPKRGSGRSTNAPGLESKKQAP